MIVDYQVESTPSSQVRPRERVAGRASPKDRETVEPSSHLRRRLEPSRPQGSAAAFIARALPRTFIVRGIERDDEQRAICVAPPSPSPTSPNASGSAAAFIARALPRTIIVCGIAHDDELHAIHVAPPSPSPISRTLTIAPPHFIARALQQVLHEAAVASRAPRRPSSVHGTTTTVYSRPIIVFEFKLISPN